MRSLRFRLAAWYFCSVALISSVAGAAYWYAIRTELDHALDQGLRYRLIGLREFLDDGAAGDGDVVAAKLAGIARLGELHQVFDERGVLISQSAGLARHDVPQHPPQALGDEIRFGAGGTPGFPLRLAWQRVTIGSRALVLCVADPQRKFEGVLGAFTTVLLWSLPIVMGVATLGGVWLGRRALSPVARITDDARTIGETNLSARLAVPDTGDELQRLSITLNEMLDRIDRSFTRTRQFTADASHELRAPMTLIHTAAQHALRRERTREELVEGMQKIFRESQRTTRLINDLLQVARGDAGREASVFETIDVLPIARDVAEQARAVAAATEVDVQFHADVEALPLRVDADQFRRLLVILVDNGVKYTPPGGRVTITVRAQAGEATIAVADTGVGIAPDDMPHVFERFWRADTVRTRETGGSGLGLTIARQIAVRHGAQIDVRSEIGSGATFTVRIPAATS